MCSVSVIMSAYNEELNITRSIESILNQTYKDFEFVIINDGSTDQTEAIIKKYQKRDSRIRLISKTNTGLADSLNIGIKYSIGKYIARMDADDVAHKDRLKIQSEYLDNNPEVAMVGSWCYLIDLSTNKKKKCEPPILYEDIKKYMQKDNPFIHSSVMFRKAVVENLGYYKLTKIMADYNFWIRIAKHYKVVNIPLYLITRYENRNFYNRPCYKGLKKYDIYLLRLKNQFEAVKNFGIYPETVWYLSRTAICMALCKLGFTK